MVRKNKGDEDDWRPPAKTASRKRPKTWAGHQTTSLRKALLTNKKKKGEARPVVEDDDNINAQYYEDFRQHVVDLRGHLAGKWTGKAEELEELGVGGEQMGVNEEEDVELDSDEDISDDGKPFDPFTATNWTDVEKCAFFHAVATHSRLRPDLIAASIKTKNMYEVCLYMRFLDDALAQLREDDLELDSAPESTTTATDHQMDDDSSESETSGEGEKSNGKRPAEDDDDHRKPRAFESDASKKARRDAQLNAAALLRRNAAPRVMEMSVPWIEFEERLAKLLCSLDDDDQRRGGNVAFASAAVDHEQRGSDSHGSPRKKQKFSKKDKGKDKARESEEESEREGSRSSSPSQSHPSTSSKDPSIPGPSNPKSTAPAWNTSNVYFLDGHLQVLETILRDAEDARAAADLAGQTPFIQEKMQQRSRSKSRASAPHPPASVGSSPLNYDETATASVSTSTFRVVGQGSPAPSSSTMGRRESNAKSKGKENVNYTGNEGGRGLEDVDEGEVDSCTLPHRGEREGSEASTSESTSSSRPHPKSELKSLWKLEAKGKGKEKVIGTDRGEDGEGEEQGEESTRKREDEENGEECALMDPDLCPTVRRRFLNRIYMRKRRAMRSGGLEAVEKVDTKSVRLRPGRKKKNGGTNLRAKSLADPTDAEGGMTVGKKRKRNGGDDGEERSEGEDDDNVDDDRLDKRDKKDKFWNDIEEAGIDEATLANEGMAYFNLSMLGKLLNYFSCGYRDRTIPGQPVISASLIRVMFTTVAEFVVDVIHRSVVLSECRGSVRTGSKVFRQNNDYITVESVKLALEIAGHPLEDRKTFLARLLHDKDASPPLRGTIIQPTISNAELAGVAFHRSLHLPFIQLPREYGGQGVREEEEDAIEEMRGKRGYLEALGRQNGSEEEVVKEVNSEEGRSSSGEGDDDDLVGTRRVRPLKGKEKAVQDDDDDDDEDPELLALCEDPVLSLGVDDGEDEEYERQMVEEEELDASDMSAAKDFEMDVWDRTLEAGEVLPT